jgi:dTDP-4-dehydrorhamnose reductase
MKKVVLVTGGTGLVGSAINKYVKNCDVYATFEWVFIGSVLDLASNDYSKIFNFFKRYRPSFVIHLGTISCSFFKKN